MNLLDIQKLHEDLYSKRVLRDKIDNYLSDSSASSEAAQLTDILRQWLVYPNFHQTKLDRLQALARIPKAVVIRELITACGYAIEPTTIQQVASQMSASLKWPYPMSTLDKVKTCAELICLLAIPTTLYNVSLSDQANGIIVQSLIPLPADIKKRIQEYMYMPPMVLPPNKLLDSNDSTYYTVPSINVTGTHVKHDVPINLDILNIAAEVAYVIDVNTFSYQNQLEELSPEEAALLTPAQLRDRQLNHDKKVRQTLAIATFIDQLGIDEGTPVHLYFPWFYDSRGRMYPHGYHLTPNGTDFDKAALQLANKLHVDGVYE